MPHSSLKFREKTELSMPVALRPVFCLSSESKSAFICETGFKTGTDDRGSR